MTDLKNSVCTPCEEGGTPMNQEQIAKYIGEVPTWKVVEEDYISKLVKEFSFENFVEAIKFADKVAELAEENGHHPKLIVEWGKVTVIWWTHAVKGLHHNDFVMAAKTEEIL